MESCGRTLPRTFDIVEAMGKFHGHTALMTTHVSSHTPLYNAIYIPALLPMAVLLHDGDGSYRRDLLAAF